MRTARLVMPMATAALLVLATAFSSSAQQQPATRPDAKLDPQRWSAAIQTFEDWDRKNSAPKDALLFVGSSSIVGWSTARSFADWPVINRGFGGSHLADVTYYIDRVVFPYKPRAIVLYAGDNDVAASVSAEQVAADFATFVERVRVKLPQTPIVFLSIKPSRARWEHWPTMRDANQRIAEACRGGSRLHYVDVGSALLDERGVPREELFKDDRLHLNEKGYTAWDRVVRPVLAELMK